MTVTCPGCGAGLSKAMITAGECGYCHMAIVKPEAPKVVHVTRVEVKAPSIELGGLFDSVMARVMGCFSGCATAGITLAITAFTLGMVAWQLWLESSRPVAVPAPVPAPAPIVEQPAPAPAPASRPGKAPKAKTDRPRRER